MYDQPRLSANFCTQRRPGHSLAAPAIAIEATNPDLEPTAQLVGELAYKVGPAAAS